jgi:hypothetical protein
VQITTPLDAGVGDPAGRYTGAARSALVTP